MREAALAYNERAWAMDLAVAIADYARTHEGCIRRATGEYGLHRLGAHTLFPDLLLFADESFDLCLQGWELKFPETSVDDATLLDNAKSKAAALGLRTFIVWNVNHAVLWQCEQEADVWVRMREWTLRHPLTRESVAEHRTEWLSLLRTLLADLNDWFAGRMFRRMGVPFERTVEAAVLALVTGGQGLLAKRIDALAIDDRKVGVVLARWVTLCRCTTIRGLQASKALANTVLLGWTLRLVAAHGMADTYAALRRFCAESLPTTAAETLKQLKTITAQCDHAHLFGEGPLDACLPETLWEAVCAFHSYLRTVAVSSPNRLRLQRLLERLIPEARRKSWGQFPTPSALARLMVGVAGPTREPMWDPCCGTGTIAQALCEVRERMGETPVQARSAVWASDIDDFALRLTSLALSHPEAAHKPIRVFAADATRLPAHDRVTLVHPDTGVETSAPLPSFGLIISNLPFVRFEDAPSAPLPDGLGGRADYAMAVLFALGRHLSPTGRMAVLLPNAWFGTAWGRKAFEELLARYDVEAVVVSGKGRWFANAKVVVSLLLLAQKGQSPYGKTCAFVETGRAIEAWDEAYLRDLECAIVAHQPCREPDGWRVRICPIDRVCAWLQDGLALTTAFAGMGWWEAVRPNLCPIRDIFHVGRGVRWGWDAFFYPSHPHGIEPDYLKPLVKTPATQTRLLATPDGTAFCCDRALDALQADGHTGALAWIESLRSERLGHSSVAANGDDWYRVSPGVAFDFAVPLNPYRRHLVLRLPEQCVLNQRFTGLAIRPAWRNRQALLHALLNSMVMALLCEAVGFGRGEGVLDMSAAAFSALSMPDPDRVDVAHERTIVSTFEPLLRREILPLREEFLRTDRLRFERTVLEAFGLGRQFDEIMADLFVLQDIRLAVIKR